MSVINEALKKAVRGKVSVEPQEAAAEAISVRPASRRKTPGFLPIFISLVLAAAVFAAGYYLYSENERERGLRRSSQETITRLEAQLESARVKFSKLESEKKGLESIILEREKNYKTAQETLAAKLDRLNENNRALQTSQSKNQATIADLTKKSADLRRQNESLSKEIQSLKDELQSSRAKPAVNA